MRAIFWGLPVLVLGLTACGGRDGDPGPTTTVTPNDLVKTRDYGWLVAIPEPQAAWQPGKHVVVSRVSDGLALYREGYARSKVFTFKTGQQPWNPAWIDDERVVFGPEPVVRQGEKGHLILPSDGLLVTALEGTALGEPQELVDRGYRPRPWPARKGVVVSWANEIRLVEGDGESRLIEEGFAPEPQRYGPGLAWRDKPFIVRDYWTAVEGPGSYFVRWEPGRVDRLPGAVQVAWGGAGGIYAVILDGDRPKGAAWHTGDTRLVYLSGPGAEPEVIAEGVHDPAPHPAAHLIAVTDAKDRLVLLDHHGGERTLADEGSRATWSDDGTHLCFEQATDDLHLRFLAVHVFTIRR